MSEDLKTNPNRRKRLATNLKVGGAVLVAAATGAVAGNRSHHEAGATQTADVTAEIANDIALRHTVPVIEKGEAVVVLKDGTQVNINNPIISGVRNSKGALKSLAVAERTRGSDQGETSAVTAYVPGEQDVSEVLMFGPGMEQEGTNIGSPDTAQSVLDSASYLELNRSSGLSGGGFDGQADDSGDTAGYFKVVNKGNTSTPYEHVAQGAEYDHSQKA